jgi:hypothetical protein
MAELQRTDFLANAQESWSQSLSAKGTKQLLALLLPGAADGPINFLPSIKLRPKETVFRFAMEDG